jgi:hypothetical protein
MSASPDDLGIFYAVVRYRLDASLHHSPSDDRSLCIIPQLVSEAIEYNEYYRGFEKPKTRDQS